MSWPCADFSLCGLSWPESTIDHMSSVASKTLRNRLSTGSIQDHTDQGSKLCPLHCLGRFLITGPESNFPKLQSPSCISYEYSEWNGKYTWNDLPTEIPQLSGENIHCLINIPVGDVGLSHSYNWLFTRVLKHLVIFEHAWILIHTFSSVQSRRLFAASCDLGCLWEALMKFSISHLYWKNISILVGVLKKLQICKNKFAELSSDILSNWISKIFVT